MDTHAGHPELRELDHRRGDGFDVTLLWNARSGKVYVAVEDAHALLAEGLDGDHRGRQQILDHGAATSAGRTRRSRPGGCGRLRHSRG